MSDFNDLAELLEQDHGLMRSLAEPSRAVTPTNPSDPARLGYPPTFPIEIALRVAPIRTICESYGVAEEEWDRIRFEPLFLRDLKAAVELVQQEGMSFRIKAKLQAEELLKTSWRLIHDPVAPPNVKAALIQATMRWANYDTPAAVSAGAGGPAFSININFAKPADIARVIEQE